jgi:hypothetical protein
MSILKTFEAGFPASKSLNDQDLERAQTASSNPFHSTTTESSASAKSSIIETEHEEAKSGRSMIIQYCELSITYEGLEQGFFFRKASAILQDVTKLWQDYRARKEIQKQVLEEIYSKLKTEPRTLFIFQFGLLLSATSLPRRLSTRLAATCCIS